MANPKQVEKRDWLIRKTVDPQTCGPKFPGFRDSFTPMWALRQLGVSANLHAEPQGRTSGPDSNVGVRTPQPRCMPPSPRTPRGYPPPSPGRRSGRVRVARERNQGLKYVFLGGDFFTTLLYLGQGIRTPATARYVLEQQEIKHSQYTSTPLLASTCGHS